MKAKNKIILLGSLSVVSLSLFGYSAYLETESKKSYDRQENKTTSDFDKTISDSVLEIDSSQIFMSLNSSAQKEKTKDLPTYSLINGVKSKKVLSNVLLGIDKLPQKNTNWDIDAIMNKKWETEIGGLSYRSNFELVDNFLYVGSNGNYFRDWHTWDEKNGVYKLSVFNGKVIKKFADGDIGDLDVNGLLYHNYKLYFGNDNDEFLCTDLNGEIIWRIPVSGDVEHQPTLIKKKGNNLIVFATEVGEIRAVNPENGNTVWQYFDSQFNGWKSGENRFIFKLKTHFKSGSLFFSKPGLADLNSDGIDDLLYAGSTTLAINGRNGKLMWTLPHEINPKDGFLKYKLNHFKSHPTVIGKGKNARIFMYALEYNKNLADDKIPSFGFEKNGVLLAFDNNGSIVKKIPISSKYNRDYNYSFFETNKINKNEVFINSVNTIYFYNLLTDSLSVYKNFNKKQLINNDWGDDYHISTLNGIVQVYPSLFNTKLGYLRLVKWEYGSTADGSNFSQLKFIRISDNKEILSIKLNGGGSEAPLLIKDIDNNGKNELIIAANRKIYCYDFSKLKI